VATIIESARLVLPARSILTISSALESSRLVSAMAERSGPTASATFLGRAVRRLGGAVAPDPEADPPGVGYYDVYRYVKARTSALLRQAGAQTDQPVRGQLADVQVTRAVPTVVHRGIPYGRTPPPIPVPNVMTIASDIVVVAEALPMFWMLLAGGCLGFAGLVG